MTLVGTARLVDDPATKARHREESWTPFYPNRERDTLLIEVTPVRLEVVSEAAGVPGDPTTWRAHVVEFRPPADVGKREQIDALHELGSMPKALTFSMAIDKGRGCCGKRGGHVRKGS